MLDTPTLQTKWFGTLRGGIATPYPVSDSLLVFNVTDAALESSTVNAKALSPSGDWIQVQANGNWKLDVRLLFQTDAPKYTWMNDIACVGAMRGFGDGEILYDLFEVL